MIVKVAILTKRGQIRTGENAYPCDVYDKPFRQSGSLKTHKWTHTRETNRFGVT